MIASIKGIKAVADVNGNEKYLMTSEPIGVIGESGFVPGSATAITNRTSGYCRTGCIG